MVKNGEYVKGKGYYLDGKWLTSNYGDDAYKLGRLHGKHICRKGNRIAIKTAIQHIARGKPQNDYERGKIDYCTEYLAKT